MIPEKKINVLVIHADQHRAECMGCYGNKDIQTPNMDRLALDGVLFKNNFCTYPACTPSRYSLLTGLYVHQHLGWSNHCTLPSGLPTFPKLLRSHGYKTKCVGKMHFTPTYSDVGFDDMILAEQDGVGRFDDDYHRWLREKGLVDGLDTVDQVGVIRKEAGHGYWDNHGSAVSNLDDAAYSTTWIGDHCVDAIEKWTEVGHCMMVGFIKPHHPHDAPEPWASLYDPEKLSLLDGWTDDVLDSDYCYNKGYFDHKTLTPTKLKKIMAQYYASITQIDHHLGRMIQALKDNGQYDNTLIIYTSDHGDYMGYHHMCLKQNFMYDPVTRVPCIVKYPRSREAGSISEKLTSTIDLTATILSETQCKIPRVMEGMPMDAAFGRETVFCEKDEGQSYMVRTTTRKLILNRKGDESILIDLENDPHELNNLIDAPVYSRDVQELKDRLFRWLAFESVAPDHLDENGPVSNAPNVLRWDSGHREGMRDYLFAMTHKYVGEV